MWRDVYFANCNSIFCCLAAATSQKIWMEAHHLLNDSIEVCQACQSFEVCDTHSTQFLANLLYMSSVHRELVENCCQDLRSRLTADFQAKMYKKQFQMLKTHLPARIANRLSPRSQGSALSPLLFSIKKDVRSGTPGLEPIDSLSSI